MAARRRAIAERVEAAHAARLPRSADGIVRGAESVWLRGSDTHALLLLHGFNDTPQSVTPLARALQTAGWTVHAPLLPGHGVDLPTMAATSRAEAWLACARTSYAALRATHQTVALCGLSMGGALASLLAAEHAEVPALVLLAPYLGMPKRLQLQLPLAWAVHWFTPYLPGTSGDRSLHDPEARARALGAGASTARTLTELRVIAGRAAGVLPALQAPTLYLQSREDNRISVAHATRQFARIGSAVKEQRWLTGCGHIITADYCRDEVARQVTEWLARWAGGALTDRATGRRETT